MAAPIEREFKAASRVRTYLIAIGICIAVGFAGSTLVMIGGEVTGLVLLSGFVAIPLILFVFLAVRDSASTPAVIVSDRGLERSNADRTTVMPWSDIVAVDLVHDGETTRIRYLTRTRLDREVARLLQGDGEATTPTATEQVDATGDDRSLKDFDVVHLMRAEHRVMNDLPRYGEYMPTIPKARAEQAALEWADVLRQVAGERYLGLRKS